MYRRKFSFSSDVDSKTIVTGGPLVNTRLPAPNAGPIVSERHYHQTGCAITAALEVVGDRWTLLIVRELMGGQRRFNELMSLLPGLAPNLLSSRLKQLTASGLIQREYFRELPPRTEYSLTATGQALRPILVELLRWGHAHVAPPSDPVAAMRRWLTSLPLVYQPVEFNPPARIRLTVDGEGEWLIQVHDSTVTVSEGSPSEWDVELRGDHETLAALFERRLSIERAASTGALQLEGDRPAAERFFALLPGF